MVKSSNNREWRFVAFDTAALQQAINHFNGSESQADYPAQIHAVLTDVASFNAKLNAVINKARKLSAPSTRFVCACALQGCKRIASAKLLNDRVIGEIVRDFERDVALTPVSRVFDSKLLAGDLKAKELLVKKAEFQRLRGVLSDFQGLVWLPDRGCRSWARLFGLYAGEILGIIEQLQPPFEALGLNSECLGEDKKLDYYTVKNAMNEQDHCGSTALYMSFLKVWVKFKSEPAHKQAVQNLILLIEASQMSYAEKYEQMKALQPEVFAKLESISVRQSRDSFIESLSTHERDTVLLPLSWSDALQYGLTIYRLFRLQDPQFLQIKGLLLTQGNFEIALESYTGERLQDVIEKNQGMFPLHLYQKVSNCLFGAAIGLNCYKMGISQISPSDLVITKTGMKIWPLCHLCLLKDDEGLLWSPMEKFIHELIESSCAKKN